MRSAAVGAPQARNSWLLYMAVRKFTADGKDSHRNDHAADHPGDWLANADGEVAEGRNEPEGENHLSDQLQKRGIPGRRMPWRIFLKITRSAMGGIIGILILK